MDNIIETMDAGLALVEQSLHKGYHASALVSVQTLRAMVNSLKPKKAPALPTTALLLPPPPIVEGTFKRGYRAKLTVEKVRSIRSAWDGTYEHVKLLAKEYSVTPSCIYQIVHRHTWKRIHQLKKVG